MHARVVLGVGEGVLFRELSSVQGSGIEGFHCTPTACVPWEKLSRAMHRPIPISDTSLSTSFEAGPAYNTHTYTSSQVYTDYRKSY